MNALTEKRYLTLPEPSAGDTLAARERLLAALPEGCRLTLGCMQQLYPVLHEAGYRVTVTLCPGAGGTDVVRVEPGDTTDRNYGLCLDIGSTTMQMELVDLLSGKTLAEAACTNSQTQFGANILDRILAVKENPENLHTLQVLTLDDVRQMIERCCAQAGVPPEAVSAMTVGGNTTMLHFFLGCDPWQVFQSPYTPVFFDPGVLRASELGLPIAGNIFCMPAIANYLGGDITSGLLMTDLDTREDLALFLDIGTNGEMALGNENGALCCAVASGPAFEGAGISCGMPGITGAVSHVRYDRGFLCDIVGGGEAKGICGSGLVDLVAVLLDCGVIDESGRLLPPQDAPEDMRRYLTEDGQGNGVFHLTKAVSLTARDVRNLQLAKAAVAGGIRVLLEQRGVTADDIASVELAGGFGNYLSPESAVRIGMLPRACLSKIRPLGNAALAGASMLALDGENWRKLAEIPRKCRCLELSGRDDFSHAFTDSLTF